MNRRSVPSADVFLTTGVQRPRRFEGSPLIADGSSVDLGDQAATPRPPLRSVDLGANNLPPAAPVPPEGPRPAGAISGMREYIDGVNAKFQNFLNRNPDYRLPMKMGLPALLGLGAAGLYAGSQFSNPNESAASNLAAGVAAALPPGIKLLTGKGNIPLTVATAALAPLVARNVVGAFEGSPEFRNLSRAAKLEADRQRMLGDVAIEAEAKRMAQLQLAATMALPTQAAQAAIANYGPSMQLQQQANAANAQAQIAALAQILAPRMG